MLKKNLRDKETIYFLVKADWYSSVYMLHFFCLSICLWMDMGYYSILALWTVLNMWTWIYKISLWDPVFNSSAYLFRSRTSRAYGNYIYIFFNNYHTSLLTQMVKNLLVMKETQVQSLVREDHLERGVTTHSSILAWRIPWTEEPSKLQSLGSQRVWYDWATNTFSIN